MATINAQNVNGAYVSDTASPQLTPITWTAATVTGDTIKWTGNRVLLVFRNSGASSRTVAIASTADPYNRLADVPATALAAGAVMYKILSAVGWEQSVGGRNVNVTANHAEVMIAAINLP